MRWQKLPVNEASRCYINGRPLQIDLRRKIVEDIVEYGGDFVTGFFPGNFSAIAERNRVKFDTVPKIWKEVIKKAIQESRKCVQLA